YAGNLSSLDFDVGTLLSHNTLGHAGFELTVDGRGFTAEAIDGMVKGHLSYLDFNGYRYDHIDLQGTVTDQQVTGHIFIDDAHLQLDVNGNIDLNPSMPKYAVDAVLGYAHLRELKLYKKAPLIIQDTEISTELWGNTVNNITGNFATHHLQFQIDSSAYTID